MDRDMAMVTNDNIYDSHKIRKVSGIGCYGDNLIGSGGSISLNSEFGKHLSSVVTNYYNHLNIIPYSCFYNQFQFNLNSSSYISYMYNFKFINHFNSIFYRSNKFYFDILSNVNFILNDIFKHFYQIDFDFLQKLVKAIPGIIKQLSHNYSKLHQYDKYNKILKLYKTGQKFIYPNPYLSIIDKLYYSLHSYKNTLRSNYFNINKCLNQMKSELSSIDTILNQSCNDIKENHTNFTYSIINDFQLIDCLLSKYSFINKINQYIRYFIILKKISNHIINIKNLIFKSWKILDDEILNINQTMVYIHIPEPIYYVTNLLHQTEQIVLMLNLTKSLLNYSYGIKTILDLSHESFYFTNYDITDFLKNSMFFIKILRGTSKSMDENLSEFNEILDRLKYKNKYSNYHPEKLSSYFLADITTLRSITIGRINIMNMIINCIGFINNNNIKEIYKLELIPYYLMSVMDYRVVISRLFKMLNKTDDIYNILNRLEYCQCLTFYNRVNKNGFRLSDRFKFSHEYAHSKFHTDGVKSNDGNQQCLCIVTNYVLYPSLVKAMCYLMDCELDTLSTLSRKFDRRNDWTFFITGIPQILIIMIEILDLICNWIRNKYYYAMTAHPRGVDIKCFCMYNDDPNYSRVVSIILVLSSLIENIWSVDNYDKKIYVKNICSLMSELYKIRIENIPKFQPINIKLLNPFKKCDTHKNISDEIYYYFECIKESFKSMNTNSNDISKYEFSVQISINNHITSPNKTIYIPLEFIYTNNLMKMCGNNKCKEKKLCKCGMLKIYKLSILMSNINSKLKSKMNIIKELINTLEVMVRIVKEINNTSLNKLKLLKNNYIMSNSHVSTKNIGVTNVETRNWGYDTKYEHSIIINS